MMSDPLPPTYYPTTTKIDFPPEIYTLMDILLNENSAKDEIISEATAALGDTFSNFATHFSSPSNMLVVFDAMKNFITIQPSFSDQFNYTNQLALILSSIAIPAKTL
ncbi:hypothetical protein Fcan01_20239 [Folsomia candida]|uniref:Uncharacterized protein n=1 Tax=Folsomia candida TaxID=158441 RepID=A0A226DID3_FOLCA|nr:hypothetical protein Fcan01_20239 [Folsomia candida]